MDFFPHYELANQHAKLSASNYAWIRYDEDKLARSFLTMDAAKMGTRKHNWAAETIRLAIRQIKTQKTLNMYVNDCIGWKLTPEVPLVGIPGLAFGTADAIGFDVKKNVLRISDFKDGLNVASLDQLRVYAAFFCMEYGYNPFDIEIELRIYQNNEINADFESHDEVAKIIDQTKMAVRVYQEMEREGVL